MDTTVLFILLTVTLAVLRLFLLPRIRVKQAINQVVAIFAHNNALDDRSAKTIDELGLSPPYFWEECYEYATSNHMRDKY